MKTKFSIAVLFITTLIGGGYYYYFIEKEVKELIADKMKDPSSVKFKEINVKKDSINGVEQ